MPNINKIKLSGTSYDIQDSNATKTVTLTQAQYDALVNKDPNTFYIISDGETFDPSEKVDTSAFTAYSASVETALSGKAAQSDLNTLSGTVTGHTADTTIHVTSSDKATWNAKSDFSGSYNDLTDKPTIPTVPTSNTAFTNDAQYATSGYVDSAVSGKANSSDVYTKSETSGATQISDALSGKQDTLSAGTNITIVDNVISAEGGGGKAVSAGTNISITTGETADTINCTLPITATSSVFDTISVGQGSRGGSYNTLIGPNAKCDNNYGHNVFLVAQKSGNSGSGAYVNGTNNVIIGSMKDGYLNFNIPSFSTSQSVVIGGGEMSTDKNNSLAIGYNANVSGTTKTNINNQLTIDTSNQVYIYNKNNTEMICLQDQLGGSSITVDTALDSGSTNPVANSAITEAVLVPSYRGLIEVQNDIAFPNATALYVENVTSGTYQDMTMVMFYLSGVSEVSETIMVTSFTGHTFSTEPSYMDYEWTEDNSIIFTPKTSGNYFYKINNAWDTGFGVYIIDNCSSGSSSSVIQNEIYPRLNNLAERIDSFTDTKVTGTSYNNLYNDYGGYWYHEIEIFDNNSGRFTASDKLRYDDFGYDNNGIIFVKKTSGITSGSTDCLTSGGAYEALNSKTDASAFTAHTADSVAHTTAAEKTSWNGAATNASNAVTALGGLSLVKLTQAEYDALTTKDSNTLYVIVN